MRYYEGIKQDGEREVFRSASTPTHATHGHVYDIVTGPFRSKHGAIIMALYQNGNNPHLQHVADAERMAKTFSKFTDYAKYAEKHGGSHRIRTV